MSRLGEVVARVRETAHLMVGLPSYAVYAAHMAEKHPGAVAMTEVEFFRERQEARYGGKGGGRCC